MVALAVGLVLLPGIEVPARSAEPSPRNSLEVVFPFPLAPGGVELSPGESLMLPLPVAARAQPGSAGRVGVDGGS